MIFTFCFCILLFVRAFGRCLSCCIAWIWDITYFLHLFSCLCDSELYNLEHTTAFWCWGKLMLNISVKPVGSMVMLVKHNQLDNGCPIATPYPKRNHCSINDVKVFLFILLDFATKALQSLPWTNTVVYRHYKKC